MHLRAITSILVTAISLWQAQAQADNSTDNAPDHWCGKWAGSPEPADVPNGQQLPQDDSTKRFFVEPQLLRVPFSPVYATEPKVQVPKIWGNNEFRVALLSYATPTRLYSSSKSRWQDFNKALGLLMEVCVRQGSGGAYLVPPSPGLTQSTLVVYAYAIGSFFDFQMNYYMSTPYGIDPAKLQTSFAVAGSATFLDVATAIV